MKKSFVSSRSGFSLIELLAAVVILAILAALIFTGFPMVRAKAESVRCMNNMRQLHTSLAAATQDMGHWPQEPDSIQAGSDDDALEKWWIKELEPYGATPKVWQCPTIFRLVSGVPDAKVPKLHYFPTQFDEEPQTPYRWPTQPWLVEIGNAHGKGALICFPDGAVKPMDEVVGRR